MRDFEGYVLEKLDAINSKVHKIDKKLAYFTGIATVISSIIAVVVTKIT